MAAATTDAHARSVRLVEYGKRQDRGLWATKAPQCGGMLARLSGSAGRRRARPCPSWSVPRDRSPGRAGDLPAARDASASSFWGVGHTAKDHEPETDHRATRPHATRRAALCGVVSASSTPLPVRPPKWTVIRERTTNDRHRPGVSGLSPRTGVALGGRSPPKVKRTFSGRKPSPRVGHSKLPRSPAVSLSHFGSRLPSPRLGRPHDRTGTRLSRLLAPAYAAPPAGASRASGSSRSSLTSAVGSSPASTPERRRPTSRPRSRPR